MEVLYSISKPLRATVEVFKTNVPTPQQAQAVLSGLCLFFPDHGINFDLEDCDRILRVEGEGVDVERILLLMASYGWECSVLED